MSMTSRLLAIADRIRGPQTVSGHCDVPCGVYDPAQARVEATSVQKIAQKYQDSDDPVFRDRCIFVKEERAELVKHHLMVLWADYFKPPHLEEYPQLHDLFWRAIKQASDAKHSMDPAEGQKLLEMIDEIETIFQKTQS